MFTLYSLFWLPRLFLNVAKRCLPNRSINFLVYSYNRALQWGTKESSWRSRLRRRTLLHRLRHHHRLHWRRRYLKSKTYLLFLLTQLALPESTTCLASEEESVPWKPWRELHHPSDNRWWCSNRLIRLLPHSTFSSCMHRIACRDSFLFFCESCSILPEYLCALWNGNVRTTWTHLL